MTTSLLPRDVLNIGTEDGENHFNEGIGRSGGHTDYSPSQIEGGYSSDPEFKVVIYNGIPYVQFQVAANAQTTSSGTKWPRSELREMQENATDNSLKMAFNGGSGTHWMKAKSRLMKAMTNKPWICFTQIHNGGSDLARVQCEGNKLVCRNTPPGSSSETVKTVQSTYNFTDEIDWEIGINAGSGYLKISGVQVQTFPANTSGCYFKTGCYSQSGSLNGTESSSDYARVYMRDLQHWHTGWPTPDPIGGGGGAAPVVGAGVDSSVVVNQAFTRTATETNSPTSRTWKILAGPSGVGATIGTSASLTWTPSVVGTYTLRYSATNASGTGTDDVIVTVTSAGGSVDLTTAAGVFGWGDPLPLSDEFDSYSGAPDATKWSLYDSPGHDDNGVRSPARATVQNGELILTGLAGSANTAGMSHKAKQQYGRWEIRAKSFYTDDPTAPGNKTAGYHPVAIIWPSTNVSWPYGGEYDFWENGEPGKPATGAFLHYPSLNGSDTQIVVPDYTVDQREYHNYAIEWTPDHIKLFVDGVLWHTASGGSNANRKNIQDMPQGQLTLQLDAFQETGLDASTMKIQWARVYTLTPQGGGGGGGGGATGYPSIVQSANVSTGAGGTSAPGTFGAGATAGNLLVYALSGDKNTGNLTITDNIGGAWTKPIQVTGASVSTYIAYKVATGGETTITGTLGSSSASGNKGWMAELSQTGTSAWSLLGYSTPSYSDTTTQSRSTGTTSAGEYNGLAIAVATVDTIPSVLTPSWTNSYTNRATSNTIDGPAAIFVATKDIAAGATTETTFSHTSTADQTHAAVIVVGRAGTAGGGGGEVSAIPWSKEYPDGTPYPTINGGGAGGSTALASLTGTINSNTVYNYTGAAISASTVIDFTGKSNITITGITMADGGMLKPKAGTNIVLEVNAPYELQVVGETIKWTGVYNKVLIRNSLFGPATADPTPTTNKNRYVQFGDSTSAGAQFGTVQRCTFRNKNGPGNPIHTAGNTASSTGGVQYTLVSHNHIIGTAPFDENDHESALLGISTLQLTNGQAVVEFNRFENCRSEPEVISSKMNWVSIRGNTFHNCVGSACLRHGDDGEIHDNHFYGFEEETGAGSYNRTSAGPRAYGARHHIHHNTVSVNGNGGSRPSATSLYESPLTLDEGDVAPGTTSNAHANLVDVMVENNLLVACGNPIMVTGNYSTPPTGTVRNNRIVQCANTPSDGVGTIGTSASKSGLSISGNQVFATIAAGGITGNGSTTPYRAASGVDAGQRTPYLAATQVGQGTTYEPWNETTGGGGTGGPTVNAGANVSMTNGTQFVRSAAENLAGATVTSRAWTIVSGPTGTGTTIGTGVTLTWTPTVNGTYVLRYTLVTSAGTVTDDVSVAVAASGGTVGIPPSFVGIGQASGSLSATVNPAAPAGLQTGMFQIMACISAGSETMTAVPQGWFLMDEIEIVSPAGDPGGPSKAWIYYNETGASSASWTKSGTRFHHAVRACWRDHSSLGSHRVRVPAAGSGSLLHAIPTIIPENATSLAVSVILSDLLNASFGPVEQPAGWTPHYAEGRVNQTENEYLAIADVITSVTTNGEWRSTNSDEAAVFAFILEGPIIGGGGEDPVGIPLIDAGPDESVQLLGSPFSRTAAEDDTGSAITSRGWKINTGPDGAGSILSTGISVTWAPTVAGTYVLQYHATNGVGTATDNVTVTVTAAPPVTPTQKPSARVNGFFNLAQLT